MKKTFCDICGNEISEMDVIRCKLPSMNRHADGSVEVFKNPVDMEICPHCATEIASDVDKMRSMAEALRML